jgi:hypothetical protein
MSSGKDRGLQGRPRLGALYPCDGCGDGRPRRVPLPVPKSSEGPHAKRWLGGDPSLDPCGRPKTERSTPCPAEKTKVPRALCVGALSIRVIERQRATKWSYPCMELPRPLPKIERRTPCQAVARQRPFIRPARSRQNGQKDPHQRRARDGAWRTDTRCQRPTGPCHDAAFAGSRHYTNKKRTNQGARRAGSRMSVMMAVGSFQASGAL